MKDTFNVVSMNRRAWNRVADRYNSRQDEKMGVLFNAFLEALPVGAEVLDVGSGTGRPYAEILVEEGFVVVGIDISPRMVELARMNVPRAKFLEMSMTEVEFENEFDGNLSVFSMLLLDPPRFKEVAKRIFCSLRRGGVLYLVLNEPWEKGADIDEEVLVEIMGEVMYSRAYTVEEVREAFLPLGMDEIKFQRYIKLTEEFGEEHVMEFLFSKIDRS